MHSFFARTSDGGLGWVLAGLVIATVGCAPSDDQGEHGPGATTGGGGEAEGGAPSFVGPQSGDETCNGVDDDGDGEVDEGCPCDPGEEQPCFLTDPAKAGVGVCRAGTQRCEANGGGEFATGRWGDCVGAVGPSEEICGDGIDQDCDGSDACGEGGGGSGGAGAGGGGNGGGGGGSDCTPTPEICGDGIDQDCDGADAPCDVVDVDLFLLGDCITASCPPDHPYPIGCNVLFSPGDDRGCVASTPTSSVVYFQAGDECDQGLVGGTLHCATTAGPPLGPSSCPINKPVPIYATAPSGCPAVQ